MVRKSIKVSYIDGDVITYKNETLENVTSEIFADERDPDTIDIDGLKIQWNPSLFHYCFGHGRITEEDLIEMTKVA